MRTAHGSGLDNSCKSRNAKLVEEECIDVQLLSELKLQANDLAVPLDELALLAIETCAQDSSVENGAEISFRNNFDDYAQKFFSGDGKVVPSDDEMLEMLRWAQWSSTPNFAGNCVKVSQAITFITNTRRSKLRARSWKSTRSCAAPRSIAPS